MTYKQFTMPSKIIKNNSSLLSFSWGVLFILFFSPASLAVSIDYLGKEQGLSNSNLHTIFQDSDGIIWAGTETDVNWNLGGQFNKLAVQLNDTGEKPLNVAHIYEDNQKGIWFLNFSNGIFRLDKREWKLAKVSFRDLHGKLIELTGHQVFVDKKGTIWLTTDSGVFIYNANTQLLTAIPIANQEPDELLIFNQVSYFTDNQMALATSQGVYFWQEEQKQFTPLTSNSLKNKPVDKFIYNKGYSWVLTNESVYKINNKTGETKLVFATDSSSNKLLDILIESDSSYWITAQNGIYQLSVENKLLKHFQPKRFNQSETNEALAIKKMDGRLWIALPSSLVEYDYASQTMKRIQLGAFPKSDVSNEILNIFSDTSQNLWMITSQGIAKVTFNRPTFNNYLFDPKSSFGPISTLSRAIMYDSKNRLWLGSQDKGISRYHSQTKKWDYFSHRKNDKNALSNNHVRALLEDAQGNIWAGTEGGGLNLFNEQTQKWQRFKQNGWQDHIFNLHEGKEHNLWIGHGRGITSFSTKSHEFTNYSPVEDNDTSPMVRALSPDNKNNLWIGTHFNKSKEQEKYTYARGLYKFNTLSHEWKNFNHDPEQLDSLSNDLIFAIKVDSHQDIWVGTWGGGLNLLKNDGKSFHHYTMKDGLSSNVIYAIFEDTLGSLWISSAGGLDKMIPCHRYPVAFNYQCEPIIKHYKFSAPLSEIEFDSESAFHAEDGTIFFGGLNGVLSFNPEKHMGSNPNIPKNTFFSQLRIKDQLITPELHQGLDQWIGYADKLQLSYDDQPFSLSVANNEFTQPEENQYRYRVDNGYWSSINPNFKDLTFRKLAFGQYKIEIDSSNNEGMWSNNPTTLMLTVTPPFYYSWTALTLYIIAIITGIYLYMLARQKEHSKRENQLKSQVKLKTVEILQSKNEVEKLLKEKQHFIENISHELKTPLTLIFNALETVSNTELSAENNKKMSNIKHNGKRLFNLVEQLLSLANNEQSTANKSIVELKNSCIQVINNFSTLASEKELTLTLDCKTNIELIIETETLETILSNLVSNAIKYAHNASEIKITCMLETPFCIIRVSNVGDNIPTQYENIIFEKFYRLEHHYQTEGQGIGLSSSRELAESYQGMLTLDNTQPNLVQFIVSLPIDLIFNIDQTLIEDKSSREASLQTNIGLNQCNIKLLIVEDNLEINQFLTELLASNYEVLSAHNGKEAVELIDGFQPDLILSDVMMPLMNGFELCQFIRTSDKPYSKCPIILLTAKSDIASQKQGLQVGATDYVSKPFSGEILKLKIANLLNSSTETRNIITAVAANHLQIELSGDSTANKFIQRTREFLKIHFPDPEFNVKKLSELLAMDERTLRRKSELYLSQKPKDIIREYRLQCAYEMLKFGDSISHISISCGFTTLPHFSKCFKDKYQETPKQAQRKLIIENNQ
ncbi:hybrid sensor histidine kinase/response regulator transcription factor [Colwellia sp. 20A7]|uniref:hybrid sensor histidine kinase/response regulator transcription factor n=1 Tax=Colwellia sp. 20A7 TaxID=2689569 RepID=UPI00135BB270|nr:two-component regulator propeller domain-containing protein [Colwellia sp. 20A7]